MEKVRFEHILDQVGSRGKFQMLVGTVLILVGLFTTFQNISTIVVLYTPNHWCSVPGSELDGSLNRVVADGLNWTEERIKDYAIPLTAQGQHSACLLYLRNFSNAFARGWPPENNDQSTEGTTEIVSCDSWTYETKEFQSTLVTRWNLVCDSQSKVTIAKSAYMTGILLGSLTWGFFSDRYGRRSSALIGIGVFVIAGILASFPFHFVVFVMLRFVLGIGSAGASSSLYVLLAEAVDLKIRGVIQMAYLSIPAFAMMVFSPMTFYLNDWSSLSLTISSCSTVLVATYWLVPESARWYIIKGKFEDAYATLQHVADVNGHRVEKDLLMQMIADCNRTEMRSAEVLDQQLYFKIIRDLFGRELRRNTMILYFLWGISASIYYAMTFHSPSFGNDIFSVVFLSGATEVPSYLLAITLIRYLPRRVTIVGCFIATGLFGLSSLLIPNDYVWIIAWTAFACKFFITIAFGLVYILTMEVYPTRHRHLALGTGSACARIGVIIVPSIVDAMSSYSTPILMGMYGGQALLAGFACVWLPETKSIALPETIADTIDYKSLEISLEKQRDAEHRAARLSVEDLDPNDALCESKIFS